MPQRVHTITLKIKNNGKFHQSDNGQTDAVKKDFIVWELANNSHIDSFAIIPQTGGQIFLVPPHKNGNIWTAEIEESAHDTCKYSVQYWRTGNATANTIDPKIAIQPSPHFFFNLEIFSVAVGIVVGIIGFGGISFFKNTLWEENQFSERSCFFYIRYFNPFGH